MTLDQFLINTAYAVLLFVVIAGIFWNKLSDWFFQWIEPNEERAQALEYWKIGRFISRCKISELDKATLMIKEFDLTYPESYGKYWQVQQLENLIKTRQRHELKAA